MSALAGALDLGQPFPDRKPIDTTTLATVLIPVGRRAGRLVFEPRSVSAEDVRAAVVDRSVVLVTVGGWAVGRWRRDRWRRRLAAYDRQHSEFSPSWTRPFAEAAWAARQRRGRVD